jgi:hypothetical protein
MTISFTAQTTGILFYGFRLMRFELIVLTS